MVKVFIKIVSLSLLNVSKQVIAEVVSVRDFLVRFPCFCSVVKDVNGWMGDQIWTQKWVILAPNGTNPGLFQIRFQYILALQRQNVLKTDLKKI